MVEAARILPTLMANETRLAHALAAVQAAVRLHYYRPRPPTTGDLLVKCRGGLPDAAGAGGNQLPGGLWAAASCSAQWMRCGAFCAGPAKSLATCPRCARNSAASRRRSWRSWSGVPGQILAPIHKSDRPCVRPFEPHGRVHLSPPRIRRSDQIASSSRRRRNMPPWWRPSCARRGRNLKCVTAVTTPRSGVKSCR